MSNNIEDIFSFKKTKVSCPNPKIKIILDTREKNSMILSCLREQKANLEIKKLEVGDYQVGELTIERKTKGDLYSSMISQRLKEQLKNLKPQRKKLLIIEENKKEHHKINQNSLNGLIISITAHHQIPIIFSDSEEHTSKILISLAKKEKKKTSINTNKIPKTLEDQKRFILEAFPAIGAKASQELLSHFSSLLKIFNSNPEKIEELTNKKVAENLSRILN